MPGDNRGNLPAKGVEVAERRARVVRMRAAGATPAEISQQLGITPALVTSDINYSMRKRSAELEEAVGDLRALEVEKLDTMERAAWKVLGRTHYSVSASGNVARHPDTKEVLVDDAPTLQAIGTLLRIQERRSKLLGLDQPTRSSVEVKTVDQSTVNAEIARVFAELVQGGPRPLDGYPEVRPLAIEGETGPATPSGELEDGVS